MSPWRTQERLSNELIIRLGKGYGRGAGCGLGGYGWGLVVGECGANRGEWTQISQIRVKGAAFVCVDLRPGVKGKVEFPIFGKIKFPGPIVRIVVKKVLLDSRLRKNPRGRVNFLSAAGWAGR
jgi:hypothetical protein